MNDETYPGEEALLISSDPSMNKGFVYYDQRADKILQLSNAKIYFRPQVFWKLIYRNRTVTSQTECKEVMNRLGYMYLGEL